MNKIFLLPILGLAACSGMTVSIPSQPDVAALQSQVAQLSTITTDPLTLYKVGAYQVGMACDEYLNQQAVRSNNLTSAGSALSASGVAAMGLLVLSHNPIGAAAAGLATGLAQSFLSAYQQSGTMPYSTQTVSIVINALNAIDNGVEQSPPTSVIDAVSDIETKWFYCTPAGYTILVVKAIDTATVSSNTSSNMSSSMSSFNTNVINTSNRINILVNGK